MKRRLGNAQILLNNLKVLIQVRRLLKQISDILVKNLVNTKQSIYNKHKSKI